MMVGPIRTGSGAAARHIGNLTTIARTTSQASAGQIRGAIVSGQLLPGERIREHDLAEALGISRTPIREALLLLQNEGLVDGKPRRTSVVRAFNADEIAELEASCARFRALVVEQEPILLLMKENLAFHDRIIVAAQSARLSVAARTVAPVPLAYTSLYWHAQQDRIASANSHERIVHALASRDAERAELLMKEHVFEVRDTLVAELRSLDNSGTRIGEGA